MFSSRRSFLNHCLILVRAEPLFGIVAELALYGVHYPVPVCYRVAAYGSTDVFVAAHAALRRYNRKSARRLTSELPVVVGKVAVNYAVLAQDTVSRSLIYSVMPRRGSTEMHLVSGECLEAVRAFYRIDSRYLFLGFLHFCQCCFFLSEGFQKGICPSPTRELSLHRNGEALCHAFRQYRESRQQPLKRGFRYRAVFYLRSTVVMLLKESFFGEVHRAFLRKQ